MSVYERNSKPVASTNPPPKRTALIYRTQANKEIAMTYAVFEVMSYILPNRRAAYRTQLLNAYGLDMDNPTSQAALDGIQAGKDVVNTQLAGDGTNQEFCYKG